VTNDDAPPSGPPLVRERIDWIVAVPATLAGLGLVAAGLWAGGFHKAATSDVLIDVGTAVGLLLVIVLLQRKMLVQVALVARQAAEETVERETSGLRDRVVRLENLDEAQAQERERRRQASTEPVRRLLNDELSAQVVGEVLAYGYQERLLDKERFRVRTSALPDCHVLYFLAVKAANGVPVLWLDFEPFEWGGSTFDLQGRETLPMPLHRDTTVIWIYDQDAAQIASELEKGLERVNRPTHDFSLRHALQQLAKSVEVASEARAAPVGGPARLRGTLALLVNDDWAITSFGLESVKHEVAYEVSWADFLSSGVYHRTTLRMSTEPAPHNRVGWDEALAWVTDHDGWLRSGRP
jgi:low affinity Fe/Cu permease